MAAEARQPPEKENEMKVKKASKPFTDACFTCKKRRIKCDMTKPFCNTCKSKKNLVCEGFDVKLRWSDPIEFDIYGDISANPKNSKILDSDNKDPQYQRRKIKYLHYKEEYEYYDEMDDELTTLNKVLAQHQNKIMSGKTWIIKKFGVFEGISYAKIEYQRRLKKEKMRKMKRKQQRKDKKLRNQAKVGKPPRKPPRKRIMHVQEPNSVNYRSSLRLLNTSTDEHRFPSAKVATQPLQSEPIPAETDTRFFSDFFDNLNSPFNNQNPGLMKRAYIPVTPTALIHSIHSSQKQEPKQASKAPNPQSAAANTAGNHEWGNLPSYLEDIFKTHQDTFDIGNGSVNSNELNHQDLLSTKDPIVSQASLPFISANSDKTNHIVVENIAEYYKEDPQNKNNPLPKQPHTKKNLVSASLLSANNHIEGAYNFLNEQMHPHVRDSNLEHAKKDALSLSPSESNLTLEIKQLESKKLLLKKEVQDLLKIKQKLLGEVSDLEN